MIQTLPQVQMGTGSLSEETISSYQKNGFVKVPNLLQRECVAEFREEAIKMAPQNSINGNPYENRLAQQVNIWQKNDIMKALSLSPDIAKLASQLTGSPMRIWHDHLLSKAPNTGLPTEWHQDQPYWPFVKGNKTISVWIALQDTPVEKGCMSFIPQSHELTELEPQNLSDPNSLFEKAPQLEFQPSIALPLKAGDATFHNGFCAHRAFGNQTDDWRIAHVTIYMDANTKYSGKRHVVTDNYIEDVGDISEGETLDKEWFPLLTP